LLSLENPLNFLERERELNIDRKIQKHTRNCTQFNHTYTPQLDLSKEKDKYPLMDNYHILHQIGEGSFGKVFKGRRKNTG